MAALHWDKDRLRAGAGVGFIHVVLGYALLTGLATQVVHKVSGALKTFDVAAARPLPPPIAPAEAETEAAEGEASPPNIRSKATPVVAPPPRIRLKPPPPIAAAPKAAPIPGNDRTAGSAVPGPGSGSGGIGDGPGSGGQGLGAGGGGGAARAVRTSGRLDNSDYPRSALRSGAEGTVSVRYTVGTDGRVSGCSVTRPSGHAELDAATCRLIELRFRYRPARDRSGEPVAETVRKTFDWLLPFKARPAAP